MSLYVYCLGDDLQEAAFEGVAGVGDAPVRLLGSGRLAFVVSETGDEPPVVTEENLLAHNRVNAAALATERWKVKILLTPCCATAAWSAS